MAAGQAKGILVNARAQELGNLVAYQVYIRSFQDSDGDGVGDLRGITSRLDYLAGLGINLLWITPFFPSPQADNGYDVSDYCAIEPLFGTMDDFEELARQARERGITLMLDMVFNHTSTSHAWFQRALAGDPTYQAYYKFVDAAPGATASDPGEPPSNWVSKFGGSAWEYVPSLNKWYLHLFDVSQADLNWDNPAVRAELVNVLRFWRGKGVDAFRFDVVNLISKPESWEDDAQGDGRRFYTDGPRIHEYLHEMVAEAGIGACVTVGEMSSTSLENCVGYTNPARGELSQAFSFHHLKVDYPNGEKWALAPVDVPALRGLFRTWQEGMQAGDGWNALFWSNHDQPRPNARFGDCERHWYESSTLLPTCTHLMQGTPYIYQGEELGMTNPDFTSIHQYRDVESLNYYEILQEQGLTPAEAFHVVHERSRDDARTPVQWSAGHAAGFTSGEPWIGVASNHSWLNAEAELADPHSVYAYYRRLIELRHAEPVIARGRVRFLDVDDASPLIAYERTLDEPELPAGVARRVAVWCNFSGADVVAAPAAVTDGAELLVGNYDAPCLRDGQLLLRPWEAVAFAWR